MKYSVAVSATDIITVEASSKEEAEEVALDIVANHPAVWDVDDIEEIE